MRTFTRLPVLLALSACLAFSACGGDDDKDSGDDAPAPAAVTTPAPSTQPSTTPAPAVPTGLGKEIQDAVRKAGGDPQKQQAAVRRICRREAGKLGGAQRGALESICSGITNDPAAVVKELPSEYRQRAADALRKAKTDPKGALEDARKICEDAASKLSGADADTAKQACAAIPGG